MSSPPRKITRRQDIRFKQSLLRFTVAFSAVFFLGLVSQFFIQRIPLKQKILESLEISEKYSLSMGPVEPRLRSSFLPVFGIALERVEIFEKDCPNRKVTAQNLLVTLNARDLLAGKLRIGRLKIPFLEVSAPRVCASTVASEDSDEPVPSSPLTKKNRLPKIKVAEKVSSFDLQQVFNQVDQWLKSRPVASIDVSQFIFTDIQSLKSHNRIKGRLYGSLGEQVSLKADVTDLSIGANELQGLDGHIRIESTPEGLSVLSQVSVREGQVDANLNISRRPDHQTDLKIKMEKLPLSALSEILKQPGGVSYLWASCQVEVSSPWQSLMTTGFQVEECKVDGPYGNISVQSLQGTLSELKNLQLNFQNLVLDKIIQNKRGLYFSGVLANYGVLSGEVKYSEGHFATRGVVRDSELIFSNNNLRDIQKVKKLPFQFSGRSNKWQIELQGIELDGGEFDGRLDVEFSPASRRAQGRVSFHRLRLNPRIYELMLQSKPADVKLYGKFEATRQGVNQWSAVIATPSLESDLYSLKRLKVKGQGGKSRLAKLKISVDQGSVASEAPLVSWLEPTHLHQDWKATGLNFRELSMTVEVLPNRRLFWRRGYVALKNGWQLSSEGLRDSERNLQAWLQWDRPDKKFLKWQFRGPLFSGQWSPETPWVKQWLDSHQEFLKDNSSISYSALPGESMANKINEARKKAIERLKSVWKKPTIEKDAP